MHFQPLSINGHFTVITGLMGKKKRCTGHLFQLLYALIFYARTSCFLNADTAHIDALSDMLSTFSITHQHLDTSFIKSNFIKRNFIRQR